MGFDIFDFMHGLICNFNMKKACFNLIVGQICRNDELLDVKP